VILNGFKRAFLPYHEKRRIMRSISAELDELARTAGA
jgi:adenosine deaminase